MTGVFQPGARTTPDQGGTLAVSGDSNTGYTSTTTSCSSTDTGPSAPDSDSQAKSIKWTSFAAAPFAPVSLKLKFSWTASGDVSVVQDTAGSGTASITFVVEYSVNNGSSWTTKVSQSKSVSGANVSDTLSAGQAEEVVLSVSQDTSVVQIRARADASTTATAPASGSVTSSASITTTVSGIQLELEYIGACAVLM